MVALNWWWDCRIGHELDGAKGAYVLGVVSCAVALAYLFSVAHQGPYSRIYRQWIFEPVNPTKVGPFILQGQFLRRQKEVAKVFSNFFATRILTSEQVWNSILTDPSTSPQFGRLFGRHFERFLNKVSRNLRIPMEPEVVSLATAKAIEKLPEHLGVLHAYIDSTLGLEESLRTSMEKMSTAQFERVLHPIFEEDELTLIIAGAVLGFAAGLIQQGLETGQIQLPTPMQLWKAITSLPRQTNQVFRSVTQRLRRRINKTSTDETV